MTADELKQWLIDHQHNGVTFAATLGVTPKTVYRWLKGSIPIPKWLKHALRGLAK